MRLITKSVLAGFGAVALAGSAVAAERAIHTLNVNLPDGTVAQLRYAGDTPPVVRFVPVRAVPVAMIDPFADVDRMMAQMEAEHAAMMRQVAAITSMPATTDGKVTEAALKSLPAGSVSYSFVSYSNGKAGCTQSMRMTSYGKDAAPKVEQQSAGDCTAFDRPLSPVSAPVVAKPAAPTQVKTPAPAKVVDRRTV